MSIPTTVQSSIALPDDFEFGAVQPKAVAPPPPPPDPPLGPLAAFVGAWTGKGFNTIFRPQNPKSPTPLPVPQPNSDNILELNLTSETLTFSPALGSVPNRGMVEADIFLNGVPYLQAIKDVTNPAAPVGIHAEPGLWMAVPATTDPVESPTVARMASIPHGTTINAQGTSFSVAGGPTIAPVSITPFPTGGGSPIVFPSQTATNQTTPRIPQDLAPFLAAGTITQAMLTDPNTLLRNQIAGQKITTTTVITISTNPAAPLFGGGTGNIAFLLGDKNTPPSKPNAQALQMTAIFWIETVEATIEVPVWHPGQPALEIEPKAQFAGTPVPSFSVTPPHAILAPTPLNVTYTQIQYTQTVFLNFNGLTWPHVSVATLVPATAIEVPASAWK